MASTGPDSSSGKKRPWPAANIILKAAKNYLKKKKEKKDKIVSKASIKTKMNEIITTIRKLNIAQRIANTNRLKETNPELKEKYRLQLLQINREIFVFTLQFVELKRQYDK